MNLKKASKAELIREIRNLRHWKECAEQNIQELKRRDNATKKYRQYEAEILQSATFLAIAKLNDPMQIASKWWDMYWDNLPKMAPKEDRWWFEEPFPKRIDEYSNEIKKAMYQKFFEKVNE